MIYAFLIAVALMYVAMLVGSLFRPLNWCGCCQMYVNSETHRCDE